MPELNPHPFAYVAPDVIAKEHLADVAEKVNDLYDEMLLVIPDSRERSLAITKLQEVRMWANCAIVFDQVRTRTA